MAYDPNNLVVIVAGSDTSGPSWWDYTTTDTTATVLAAGYFNTAADKLTLKDKILIAASDGIVFSKVLTVTTPVTIQGVVETNTAADSVILYTTANIPVITASAISAAFISAISISTSNLSATAIQSVSISTSNLTAVAIQSVSISTSNLTAVAIQSVSISTSNLTAVNIQAVSISTSSIFTNAVVFPAVQVASAGVNTLDDYEEGTFTPSFSFGGGTTGITYSNRAGQYTKIGRLVFFHAEVTISNNGSSTGAWKVTSLPITSAATFFPACSVYINSVATGIASWYGLVDPSATTIQIYGFAQGTGTATAADDTYTTNTTAIILDGFYST